MDNIEIGKKIKYVRDLRGVTLDDIAIKVGVAKSTIQRYESGKIEKLKLPVLHSIANSLRVNPAWLIGKSNDMEQTKEDIPIIEYYNSLNDEGKKEAEKRVEELTYIPQYSSTYRHIIPDAAHERTDDNITEEMIQHDENIMNDDVISISDHVKAKAARNDYIDEDDEIEKTERDLGRLKPPPSTV